MHFEKNMYSLVHKLYFICFFVLLNNIKDLILLNDSWFQKLLNTYKVLKIMKCERSCNIGWFSIYYDPLIRFIKFESGSHDLVFSIINPHFFNFIWKQHFLLTKNKFINRIINLNNVLFTCTVETFFYKMGLLPASTFFQKFQNTHQFTLGGT